MALAQPGSDLANILAHGNKFDLSDPNPINVGPDADGNPTMMTARDYTAFQQDYTQRQRAGGDGLGAALKDMSGGLMVGLGGPLAGYGLTSALGPGVVSGMAGGAGAAGAAGAAMPAAQALTPEALSSMGLTQTAPGVFEAGAAGATAGVAGGAGSAGGALMPPAQPLSAGAAQGLGLQPAAMPGVSGATFAQPGAAAAAGAPSALSAGGGGLAPGGAPPPGVGGTGGAAGAAGTGGSFVDSLMKQMKDNAVGLGLIGASTLMATQKAPGAAGAPNIGQIEQQLSGLSGQAQQTATQLLQQYTTGALSPGQQASLDQLTQNTKNQLKQYFASIGQSDSTAATQALAQVDQSALGMKQQILDDSLSKGLQAIGIASGPLSQIAQYEIGQDQQLRQAFGSFAGAVGNLFGRGAGTPQQTSNTAAPTISSVQAPAAAPA